MAFSLSFLRVFIALALAFLSAEAARAGSVKISTWNVEWLLSPSALNTYQLPADIPHRSEKDWQILKKYAQKLSSDIIVLEEVDGIESAKRLFPASDYAFYQTHLNLPQKEILVVRRTLGIEIQQNPDVTALSQNPNSSYPLRPGLDATLLFPNHKKLRLLGVHLKTGCWEKPEKEKKHSCPLLYKQFREIRNWIAARVKAEEDFIILGDFNRRLSLNDFAFQELTLGDPALLKLTTAGFSSPCQGGEYFIDHILLRNSQNFPLIPKSLRVQIYTPEDQKYRISDHCAVSVRLGGV